MSYDDYCEDCASGDGCWEHGNPCQGCGELTCPGYCDDYQTYNLRPAETGGAAEATGTVLHELVFTDREARPAKWQTRCGRTDVPLEQAMSPMPGSYYKVTCPACLAESATAQQEKEQPHA